MGLFTRGKSREQLAKANADQLKALAAEVKILVQMARDAETKKALEDIGEELIYSAPSLAPEAKKLENRISNYLGDLKILLTSKPDSPKIAQLIADVRLLLVERAAKTGG